MWTAPVPACNGGDLQTLSDVLSLEACQSACEQYDGCLFIVFGLHNGSPICVLKNMDGQPAAGACTGCDENGYCANTGSCDVSQTLCSSNLPQGCVCNAGFTSDGAEGCQACAAGTYKAGSGNEACTDCGAGKYSAASGATAESTCSACTCRLGRAGGERCRLGLYLQRRVYERRRWGCQACAAGTYKAGSGNEACTDCGAGKYSAASGATAESTCSACTSDSDAPAGSDAASDCICNAGFTSDGAGAVRRVPLARIRQGAATRRARTVAPGNTPTQVGRRPRARARRARQTRTRRRGAMPPRTVSATQGLRATALGAVRRVPLARIRQGAATRRARTVAPGNTPPRVGRRPRARVQSVEPGNTPRLVGRRTRARVQSVAPGNTPTRVGRRPRARVHECGAGKYSNASGATTESTCTECGAGKYSNASGATDESTCTDCGAGKFSTVRNPSPLPVARAQVVPERRAARGSCLPLRNDLKRA